MPLLTVQGPSGPVVVHRVDGDRFTLGRGEDNDLVLLDPAVSRVHVEIHRSGGSWLVADRGSRNGTLVNGEELQGVRPLAAGDELTLGDTVVWFEVTGTPERRPGWDRETDEIARVMTSGEIQVGEPRLIGSSAAIRRVLDVVAKVAPTDATVLITGENGTGKELAARLIHARSPRRDKPLVVVNCPALPGTLVESELFGVERGVATGVEPRAGRLEAADGGTLFLDEIGDLAPAAQAKLLRFLEDRRLERVGGRESREVDVRLVAATNHDLAAAIDAGTFRRDLYHRLDVVSLELPPLRDRAEDIRDLVEHFLASRGHPQLRLTDEALECLEGHSWPGNVRELQHLVESASILAGGDEIRLADLPARVRRPAAAGETTFSSTAAVARALLADVLDGERSFWEVIQEPYLKRSLPRDAVRAFVALAHERGGGSYKGMARLLGIAGQHKKLLDFLRRHDLGVRRGERGEDGSD